MKGYKRVAKISDIPPGLSLSVVVGEHRIAIFNLKGTFYAMDDVCPHAGGPLGDGGIQGNVAICPWHGWEFRIDKACAVMDPTIQLARFDVKTKGGHVYVSKEPVFKPRD